MWVKVKKAFGLAIVGQTMELKGSDHHNALLERGFVEETEAPVDEVKPVATEAYSTANVIKGASAQASGVVDQSTLDSIQKLTELSDELKVKEDELAALQADFEKAKADFDGEKTAFESEKADFEKAKADFAKSQTQTIVEPAKGKPGPKAKEDKK